MKSTNYKNTFIKVSDDCPTNIAIVPGLSNKKKTVASLQYRIIINAPYKYTSDEIMFMIYKIRNKLIDRDTKNGANSFFEKNHACLRSSPLVKRYGWGIHFNDFGYISIYAVESNEYEILSNNKSIHILRGLRNKKKENRKLQ